MTPVLPSVPNLEQLKNQAKDLLKAHRAGQRSVCATLRRLHRFSRASDPEILAAKLTLHEAQYALAMDYGFESWNAMKAHVESVAPAEVKPPALVKLSKKRFGDETQYFPPNMVVGYVRALNYMGAKMDYTEFAAACGWAFSFSYAYGDISPAFLALRGHPRHDGPYEVFRFLPQRLGYDYEAVPTADKEKLWGFLRKHLDAATPVLTEQWDGGLFYGYRERNGKREVWFVWTKEQWLDINELQPYEVCVLIKKRAEMDRAQVWREGLLRALRFASPQEAEQGRQTVPQGLSALQAYLRDVKDPAKDFSNCADWFCWATFERLCARHACAAWLRAVANVVNDEAREPLGAAAKQYAKAYRFYDQFRAEVVGDGKSTKTVQERACTPERIAVIAPILERAIEEETAAVRELEKAVSLLG